MSRRSRYAAVLAVLALSVLGAAVPPPASVLVLGDSYASGEGLVSAEGRCGTELERSWGALVTDALGGAALQLLACSGAEVADVTVGGELAREPQLEAATPAELVLLTIGGNDLGFTEIVTDCLGLAALGEAPSPDAVQGGWSELLDAGPGDTGCDVTVQDLVSRVEVFSEPDRFRLDPDGTTGSLSDLYALVAERVVVDGGRLLVVGYPGLVAPADVWPERYGQRCHGLRARDATALSEVVDELDAALAAAVTSVAERADGVEVSYLSLTGAVDGSVDGEDHRLCGGGEPWINGLTVAEGGIDVARLLTQLGAGLDGLDLERLGARPTGSFHPTAAGHRGIADAVLDHLAA